MGCFDFTTADKGTNLRGKGGYLYLTNQFARLADLPNPLKFTGTDEYGRFDFVIDGKPVTLDVYAVYGCMAVIKGLELNSRLVGANEFADAAALTRIIHDRDFDNPGLESLIGAVRSTGISAQFEWQSDKMISEVDIHVPATRRTPARSLRTDQGFEGCLPLLITKYPLPIDVEGCDLADVAERWSFVSTQDPEQGDRPLKDFFCVYKRSDGFVTAR